MDKIKVLITNRQKEVKIPSGLRLLVRRCCNAVLTNDGFNRPAEISVSFVNDVQISELNSKYRDIHAPTDVLSFAINENENYEINQDTGAIILGDIVISVERAAKQAERYGHSLQREVAFLATHSMLHLLGYKHEKGGLESMRMREKEELVMNQMGLTKDSGYIIPTDGI